MPNSIILAGDFVPRADLTPYDPFSDDVKELFQGSDYVIINLETPLTERGKPILKTGKNFRRSPQYAQILKAAGVDCVCLANNHIRDFGDEGVLDTIQYCSEAGLDIVGAGINSAEAATPLIKEINGTKVGFLNYCEREFSIAGPDKAGANPFDLIDVYRDIQDLKSVVERIFVIYHGGIEYQHYPTPDMVKSFRFLNDVGADSVVAHHAHAYSGFETYNERMISYGLGNLISSTSAKSPKDSWFFGLLSLFRVSQNSMQGEMVPTVMNPSMDKVDLVKAHDKFKILANADLISSNIQSGEYLRYWDKFYSDEGDKALMSLIMPSRFLHRVMKMLGIRKIPLSNYRIISLLNIFRCQSHRDKIIEVLEISLEAYRRENVADNKY